MGTTLATAAPPPDDHERPDAAIARMLASYTPRRMPPGRWALCAPAVRRAVVACEPRSVAVARTYMSALAWFLGVVRNWDGRSEPDLAALLTYASIDVTIARARQTKAVAKSRRAWLRCIARAIGAIPTTTIAWRGLTPGGPHADLLAAACRPVPLVDLAAAWTAHTARPFRGDALYPVFHALRTTELGNATSDAPVTVCAPTSIRRLAEAPDTSQAAPMSKTTTRHPTLAPDKPMSRRQLLKITRELAAHAKAPSVVQAAPPAEDVAAAITGYWPTRKYANVWQANRELAERLVVGYRPPNPRNARYVCSIIAGFLTFVDTWPRRTSRGPLAAADLTEDAIAAWIATRTLADSSKATFRTVVRRAVRSLNPATAPARIAYKPAAAPYSIAEAQFWRFLADHQPTPTRCANLSFVVGLGAGAGFDAADLRSVTAASLTETTVRGAPVLLATTANPRRPRTVPVRAQYAPLVRHALALHHQLGKKPQDPVIGRVVQRLTVTRTETRTARTATEPVVVDLTRLRNTWLVAAMCVPVPIADLMRAAGLSGARTLADLLPHCPPPDPTDVSRLLATMEAAR